MDSCEPQTAVPINTYSRRPVVPSSSQACTPLCDIARFVVSASATTLMISDYSLPVCFLQDYSLSWDVFLRGQEIVSGAQRVHDYNLLAERVAAKGMGMHSHKLFRRSRLASVCCSPDITSSAICLCVVWSNLNLTRFLSIPPQPSRLWAPTPRPSSTVPPLTVASVS